MNAFSRCIAIATEQEKDKISVQKIFWSKFYELKKSSLYGRLKNNGCWLKYQRKSLLFIDFESIFGFLTKFKLNG